MHASGLPFILTFALFLGAASAAQAQLRYRIESLGVLGPNDANSDSTATALNNHGTVVGYSVTLGDSVPTRAFVYENGQIRSLGNMGTLTTAEAHGINNRGQIVGFASNNETSEQRPFLYDRGTLKDLNPDPGFGNAGYAFAINESGQVAGTLRSRAYVHDGTQPNFIPFGSEITASIAWGINDHGVAVGRTEQEDIGLNRAFVWDGSTLSYLPAPQGTSGRAAKAVDINNAGQIVVNSTDRAFLYGNGGYQALGTLDGGDTSTQALAVNGKGWVVGRSAVDAGSLFPNHAFLWRSGRMQDLNDLLDTAAAGHWEIHDATDINDRGQIVGRGTVDGLQRAFIATPVPEAGTWTMLLAGLGAVGAVAWRRKHGPRD